MGAIVPITTSESPPPSGNPDPGSQPVVRIRISGDSVKPQSSCLRSAGKVALIAIVIILALGAVGALLYFAWPVVVSLIAAVGAVLLTRFLFQAIVGCCCSPADRPYVVTSQSYHELVQPLQENYDRSMKDKVFSWRVYVYWPFDSSTIPQNERAAEEAIYNQRKDEISTNLRICLGFQEAFEGILLGFRNQIEGIGLHQDALSDFQALAEEMVVVAYEDQVLERLCHHGMYPFNQALLMYPMSIKLLPLGEPGQEVRNKKVSFEKVENQGSIALIMTVKTRKAVAVSLKDGVSVSSELRAQCEPKIIGHVRVCERFTYTRNSTGRIVKELHYKNEFIAIDQQDPVAIQQVPLQDEIPLD